MSGPLQMSPFSVFIALLFVVCCSNAEVPNRVGINYGRLGNNLPSPGRSIEHVQSLKAGLVKIYDADPEILTLLSGTGIRVSIMVPNREISDIAYSQFVADQWVRRNVLPYYPGTMIRFVLIGNEVLSYNSSEQDLRVWRDLVPAMHRIEDAIRGYGIRNIKVGTPLAMDAVESTFPPSSAVFRDDVTESIMRPLLRFLNGTQSYFFLDVYPYFPWSADTTNIPLDHALFQGRFNYVDPGSRLVYTNLLDQMLDSVIFAMAKLGYPDVPLFIAETGWPNAGDPDQPGANVYNAAMYNGNLVTRMTADPPIGTPARPGLGIETVIFSLYDENQKQGPGTERHWGLLHADGSSIYGTIDLSGP